MISHGGKFFHKHSFQTLTPDLLEGLLAGLSGFLADESLVPSRELLCVLLLGLRLGFGPCRILPVMKSLRSSRFLFIRAMMSSPES